ncbi:MAG: flagellar hook-basal body complex protein [Clostridiales bacterium]|nr:flagellar hook-basal body complex protein [Clostridiales bacterium]
MIRGHYIAATGMMLQRRKMEVITNNITNVETTGYKKDNLISLSFDDVLIERIHDRQNIHPHRIVASNPFVGPLNFGTHVDYIQTDFAQGNLETTELPTDLAIIGNAFFVLDTPQGICYSRSGALTINVDGYLCNADGFYVTGENGRIYIGSTDFNVDEQGNISAAGGYIDTLNMVDFADANVLRKQGDNLYTAPAGAAAPATEYSIRQYVLESSNVDIGREMVDMMIMYRAYESNQRMLTMIDETVGKAVNDIGRLR